MTSLPEVSIIIAVYNHFDWLEMILTALKYQSFRDFEVIIADDGSNSDTVEAIARWAQSAPFTIRHCWHDDRGWRKNIMLNTAVRASSGRYLAFLDGDCIPSPSWLADHIALRKHHMALAGRRMDLPVSISNSIKAIDIDSPSRLRWLALKAFAGAVKEGTHGKLRCLRFPCPQFLPLLRRKKDILGCNFSLYKDDLLAVNGFDERYLAPGTGEDTDLELRLTNAGMTVSTFSHYMIVYHRNHQRLAMDSSENAAILAQNRADKVTATPYGINRR